MVEGETRRRFSQNVSKHRVRILKKLGCRYSQRLDACRSKPLISCPIALGLVAARVPLAIDFDRQASIAAEEIQHVGASGVLTTELETVWTLAKPVPQDDFR